MTGADRPPVRVAFILHVMQVAGAEVLVSEIIQRLGPAIEPVVVCLDGIGELGERTLARGVPVISLDRRPGLDLRVTRRMARELSRRRIDVVHAHQYAPFFYAAVATLQMRRRPHVMFTEHGRHYPDVVSARRRFANRMVLARLADSVTAVCEFSARSLVTVEGFPGPVAVVPNGVDLPPEWNSDERRQARLELGLAPDRRYVICVARFHPVKDHPMLLRAFAKVAGERSEADLLLVGDGPERQALQTLAAALGIESRVTFLGVRRDIPRLLQSSDIFAMTSVSEAASLTLLEAMAAGRAVVVTDVGGNAEHVRSGTEGLLVPRGDAEAAATALLQLLTDEDLRQRLGAAARRRVEAQFTLAATIRQYGERYVAARAGLSSSAQ